MLLAYIDEIGEPGPFVSPDHPRFNTSPAFGYAGFVVPETEARDFGALFTSRKRELFRTEMARSDHPERWERKGAAMFRSRTPEEFPQYLRVMGGLVKSLRERNGHLFYYADEKPRGTPKQTHLNVAAREEQAMRESLNRLARHAAHREQNVLVMIDQINEKDRATRLPRMYAHIFARSAEHAEMRRIVEPPMHIDSELSSNIQFADWVAAIVSRALDYQLIRETKYTWVPTCRPLLPLHGSFTYESKLHLTGRAVRDLNHSEILARHRPLFPAPPGHSVEELIDPAVAGKMHKIFEAGRAPKE